MGKNKKAVAEDPRNPRGGTVFGWAPLQDSIFLLYNPLVLTVIIALRRRKQLEERLQNQNWV